MFTPNLEGATDRAATMVMVARALDWINSEDWDEDAVSGLDDVPDWAEPHVAYAVQMEITYGIGGNLFGNNLDVTERQLETWFDRALGKGDTWDDNEDLDNETALIRADLVDSTWNALMQVPVDGEETLIETIIGDDEDMLLVALDGGLVPVSEVEIDPDDYEVTVDDVEQGPRRHSRVHRARAGAPHPPGDPGTDSDRRPRLPLLRWKRLRGSQRDGGHRRQ